MIGGTETVVSFESPPVVEVVAGAALTGPGPDAMPIFAAFWKERLREAFPVIQQQSPYSPPIEQFEPVAAGPTFTMNFGIMTPAVRLWAQSHDGSSLIQLQPDYFACNWRKVQPSHEYDRWPSRRAAFAKWLSLLSQYLLDSDVGEPKVSQCEVTYINHITAGRGWEAHADYSRVFNISSDVSGLPAVEQLTAQLRFILHANKVPYGRLYANITPAYAPDGRTPLYVLELTARGFPVGDGLEGALTFLDRGRQAVDLAFVALTTEAMHREWGLRREPHDV